MTEEAKDKLYMEIAKVVNSILTTLLIIFVVLKLTDVIAWTWWIVVAPFWIPLIIAIVATVYYICKS